MGKVKRFPTASGQSRLLSLIIGGLCLVPSTLGMLAGTFGWLPHNPMAFVGEPNAPSSPDFLLGCDALGRDLFSRLGAASAYFTPPGALAMGVALLVGGVLGVAESLGGKIWGAITYWLLQVLDSLPKFVLVLLVASIARSDLVWIMTAVGVTFAPQIAGAIRSSVERLRVASFIEAERCLGVSMTRIVFVHILWGHARRVILAQLMSLMAYALLVETSLSYLGGELGVQEPTPSWGNMISLARDGVFTGHLMQALLPALMISVTLVGFTLVGQGLLSVVEERG
jgi:peptide/nickel transport system permease protein